MTNNNKIKEELLLLRDYIFENLPQEKANQFAIDFKSLSVNDLRIVYKFKIIVLEFVKQYANDETLIIINNIIKLHNKSINGENVDYSSAHAAAKLAANAAHDAADADDADDSVTRAPYYAAASAAHAALSTINSAARAADCAAEAAHAAVEDNEEYFNKPSEYYAAFAYFADQLIKLNNK